MTPKEKAKELIGYYYPFVYCYAGSGMLTNTVSKEAIVLNAKQCALIAVAEILLTLNKDIKDLDVVGNVLLDLIDYWKEVKQEIENL